MKKAILLCLAAIACAANAEVIKLDLTTATDAEGNAVKYDHITADVMDSVYSEHYTFSPFFYANDAKIMLSHLPSGNSWNGRSWEGFVLSKKNTSAGDQFECVAKGGLGGEGTPFAVGYFSEYYTNTNTDGFPSSNLVQFTGKYYPTEVYICQSSNTLKAITDGMPPARKFTDSDVLSLIITGIDDSYRETTNSVVYNLASEGKFNTGWEKVNLSSIGLCNGLSFRMTSTDANTYGINTPTYFAMDGLTISSTLPTGLSHAAEAGFAVYAHGGRFVIENADAHVEFYSLQGHRLLTTTDTQIDVTAWPDGIYIAKCGGSIVKVVK